MRAVWLREFGGPAVLVAGDAPDPVPGPGQVLIEVAFANVTFVETQFRATGAGPFAGSLPMVPGNGVGGVISRIGEGVAPALIGKRVVTSTGGSGGYAQRAVVDAELVFPVPQALSLDAAVALLADGRTATGLVRATAVAPGERVLVEAAAGGVGSLLVQLAKAAGAEVVAAAGGAEKAAQARDLGAALAVDYTNPQWTDEVGPVDVVFDGVGGEVGTAAYRLVRPGGRMAIYGLSSGSWAEVPEEEAAKRGVEVIRSIGDAAAMREYTESALEAAAAGQLTPVIGQRFPLERAADAHAAIESRGTIGKTLLVA
ncbi:zinc-binding dehydrogenase [Amycolatopsis benzoatilytica]|uniref:zinc-binding dehydrogenase n=1 Tax=Amycolatopsis benzoatilytica TaxID=346045 RepID=UPI00036986FA|nr:zinc-binding dehydrogenase [Amycolatopsis benzoatilytica]